MVKDEEAKAYQQALDTVVEARTPFLCGLCDCRFSRQDTLDEHYCDQGPPPDASKERATLNASPVPFETPATLLFSAMSTTPREPLMGHGLITTRQVSFLNYVVKRILEVQYLKGVDRSSARKGILEMVEASAEKLPHLMSPLAQEVASWLSTRLSKDKKTSAAESSSATLKIRKIKSAREKLQEDGAIITKEQNKLRYDFSMIHLVRAKYRDTLLITEDDNTVWIVTDVEFSTERKVWTLLANASIVKKFDDRVFTVNPDSTATTTVDVGRGKGRSSSSSKHLTR